MNIYKLFRQIIEGIVWRNEALKADALKLIDDLETMNAFGTIAGTTEANAHEHSWEWQSNKIDGIAVWWRTCRSCRFIDQNSRTIQNPNGWNRR